MKLSLAIIILGVASSSAFASTTASPLSTSTRNIMAVPALAAVGAPVPEPATLGLLGVGAASLLLRRKRK